MFNCVIEPSNTNINNPSLEFNTFIYKMTWPFMYTFIQYIRIKKYFNNNQNIKLYSKLWDGLPPIKRMRDGAARWPALDTVYNWKLNNPEDIGILESYYLNARTCQALRNRYKIVVSTLINEIERSFNIFGEAKILSIAAGTCQSVFEACSHFDAEIKILALDSDITAINASKDISKYYNVNNVEWINCNVLKPHTVAANFNPTIIEVVGLFDYLGLQTIRILLKKIQMLIRNHGVIITAHIHKSTEALVLKELLDWNMIYRSTNQFKEIMSVPYIHQKSFITEPHSIFTVMRGEYINKIS